MNATEILAAARANVVGPYLPARAAWTEGWTGPCEVSSVHDWQEGVVLRGGRLLMTYGGRSGDVGFDRCTQRLDANRPEVRDHLVRLGCPEWARDVSAGVWCWGMGAAVKAALGEWDAEPPTHGFHCRWPLFHTRVPGGYLLRHEAYEGNVVDGECKGFGVVPPRWSTCGVGGPAPWGECMAAADLAALNAGCILREPGGWLVPLPGGGIGFFRGGES